MLVFINGDATGFDANPLTPQDQASIHRVSDIGAGRRRFVINVRTGEWSVAVSPIDYAAKARKRIAEIRSQEFPWEDTTQCMAAMVTSAVTMDAEVAAIAVFSNFTMNPPTAAVAIFPREDGGLRIQSVGEERAVVVDISADGDRFGGEYAGDDVYHSQTMRTADDAAQFILDSTR